ncbi:MAG: F0F1 ATP synthase subunit delta [Candidatus Binatia bacterium]
MLQFQWSTVVFQIVNFFILLAVLTRFFYRPLQRVMRQQEEEITSRLREAEERAHKADAEREQLADAAKRLRTETEAVLAKARAEAAQAGEQLLARARTDADRIVEETKQRMLELERTTQQHLETAVRQSAVNIAARLMQAAAGPAIHQALLDKFLKEGLQLDGNRQELLNRAYTHANGSVTVEVAFPSSPGLEEHLRRILTTALGTESDQLTVVCRTEPSLIAGVRLLIGAVVVDLSLSRTLTELSQLPTADRKEI